MKSALAILAICANLSAPKATAAPSQAMRAGALLRMEASAPNVERMRSAVRAAVSEDEQVQQITQLGGLHTRDNASGMNDAILADLRVFAASPSRRVARSATFPLAQSVGAEEAIDILMRAKETGLMGGEEIAGELARALRFVPRELQLRYVQLIAAEPTRYGVEVLVSGFDSRLLKPMLPETRRAIGELLRRTPVDFPRPIGAFSFGDAARYAAWLHASALTEQSVSRRPYADTVLAQLDDPQLDPRKIIAYLYESEGRALMSKVGRRAPFAGAVRRAATYADSFPGNLTVKKLVDDIVDAWYELPQ
ncbi:hypothetical protein [Massilia antarctica]|uniref:hypothetical protein n=1 Tax=Massilia antarctica TaxID=2765360 RepID=UPI0006BC4089|nr:hypothetical protein [Massilia sp. H27-R4]MCY0914572.1 hypothetical protein [Massilia sp. H27-R4]CUI03034.1 hypothetical protein BN2497_845 [Janthinobacterium sp. CG23_2]CUU26820.1 hypothetical protein BN3177_845 [Janthinobacterium sp. CG23_2]